MKRLLTLALLAAGLAACTSPRLPTFDATSQGDSIRAAFVVRGPGQSAVARVVTAASTCPAIAFDDGAAQPMPLRAAPATYPARKSAATAGNNAASAKDAVFTLRSCEAAVPAGATKATVAGRILPLPGRALQRVVVIGDTGCRLSRSTNQNCNDAADWPFARIAARAAAMRPDLVIHLGDLHYREGPCPATQAGCAGSPWGYGDDVWDADVFRPAAPLLAAAPWLLVRGNHESCARAGQGWFRFMDAQPYSEARSCNQPSQDGQGDFSAPFAVPLDAQTQLIVFDSSLAGLRPYATDDATGQRYAQQLMEADALARQAPHNIFLNHHPLLAYAPRDDRGAVWPGNAALQSVFARQHGVRLFAPQVDMAWHGHVHLFEALEFASNHPFTLVVGNSGSATDVALPTMLPAAPVVSPGAQLARITSHADYGFTTLDRVADGWALTAWGVDGQPLAHCDLRGGTGRCRTP
jgi:hypothetical protein